MQAIIRSLAALIPCLLCAALPVTALATGATADKGSSIPLFLDTPAGSPGLTLPRRSRAAADSADLGAVERLREVAINPRAIDPARLDVGDRLRLVLFADTIVEATVDSITEDSNGVIAIRARVDGSPPGHVLLSVAEDRVLGDIALPGSGEVYRITHLGQGFDHVVEDLDPAARNTLAGSEPRLPPAPPVGPAPLTQNAPQSAPGPVTLDVMIVYTPAARAWADRYANGIHSVISQAMQKGQLALDSSALDIHLRLVHSAQVDYTESQDPGMDLDRLTFHAGHDPWGWEGSPRYMDEVHQWRDRYGADLVTLVARRDDTGGIGWLLGEPTGWPEFGFSVVRVQQAHDTFTYIHEAGHNLGAGHHNAQLAQPGPGLHNHSGGWRWIGDDGGAYASVMTYGSGQFFRDGRTHRETPYFSSPAVFHQGVSAGDRRDGDNARTLRETGAVVASYRAAPTSQPEPLIFSSGFE